MRRDAELIKFIDNYKNREEALKLQKLPFIEISEEIGTNKIWPQSQTQPKEGEESADYDIRLKKEGRQLEALTAYTLRNLPWESFILRMPPMPMPYPYNCYSFAIINKESGTKYATGTDQRVKEIDLFAGLEGRLIAAMSVGYGYDNGKLYTPPQAENVLLRAHLNVMKCVDPYMINALGYLALCPERVVQVAPKEKPNRQQRKLAEREPWYRNDLPSHILIDPLQAPEYQPPEMRSQHSTGNKKSPHKRRSHWRRLPSGTIRVRESWIGNREWEYQGRSYKVMNTHANSDKDAE